MDLFDVLGITYITDFFKEQKEIRKQKEFVSNEIKPKLYRYRPKTLDEYIGQERAKENVRTNLQKIREIKPVHFMIKGTKGTGKSTLAGIIGNDLQFEVTYHIGGNFTKEALINFLKKHNAKNIILPYKGSILFVDEVHNLELKLGEYMYPLLEDFILPEQGGIETVPFIFIGATTEMDIIQTKFSPLLDRCGACIDLEPYTADDIKRILKQYNDKVYQVNITEEVYDLLSINVRYTPRIALNFFDDLMVCKDIQKVLNMHRVIKNSLTDIDIKILTHLAEIGKPIGEQALGVLANMTAKQYRLVIEPFLMQETYLTRTARGRIITDKGKKLLEDLK